jgi:hypothetical protein
MENSLKKYALGFAILAATSFGGGSTHFGGSGSKVKTKKVKSILTPKQKKQRLKNKASRKSRKTQKAK